MPAWPGQRVVLALGRLGESGEAARSADRRELAAAAGDELVGVTLVGRIPHEAIVRAVEDAMHGQGELHRAEVRGEMAAAPGNRLDDQLAAIGRKPRHISEAECIEVARGIDSFQYGQNPHLTQALIAEKSERIRCARGRSGGTPRATD